MKEVIKKKKLLKRALTLSLCACMMVGMATVASAAQNQVTTVPLLNRVGTQGYLNVYGNNTIANNSNVCMWQSDGSNSQSWRFDGTPGGDRVVRNMLNSSYCLNPDRRSGQNWNSIVYQYSGNEYDSVMRADPYYAYEYAIGEVISLKNWANFYLKADGYTNNSNVHFVYISSDNIRSQWTNYLWDVYYI